jgi:hypothetical protein
MKDLKDKVFEIRTNGSDPCPQEHFKYVQIKIKQIRTLEENKNQILV